MKKEYIKPENLVFKIALRDGILQNTSNISIGGQETEAPDDDDIGARENNAFDNNHSIWDNAW